MKEIGYEPYRPIQPNGYSDIESDWISPELLIRRMSAPKEIAQRRIALKNFGEMIDKNFDNPDKIMKLLNQNEKPIDRHILLFNLPEVFRA